MFRCRLTEHAENDIARVADYYDAQARGLGAAFIHEVRRVLDLVAGFPNAYQRAHGPVRKARIGRFPYFAAYEVFADEFVVLGVFADAQHPDRLLGRLGIA